jgi:hypothetical protein
MVGVADPALRPPAYLLGVGAALVVAACVAFCGATLRRLLLPGWNGAVGALASSVIAISGFVLLSEALGAVGLFRRWPLVLGAVLVAAAAAASLGARARRAPRGGAPARIAPVSPIEAGLVAGAVVLALTPWLEQIRTAFQLGMREWDTNWYHLPIAARFAQTGWLTRLQYLGSSPDSFLPFNSEAVHAAGMITTGRDFLSPLINLGWAAIALVAAWCLGRPWGVRAPALVAVALALSIPVMIASQAGSAGNDVVGLALLLACTGLIVNAPTSGRMVATAGLAAGLAVGTKLTLVAPILALTVTLAVIWIRARRRHLVVVWTGALLLTGCFWYVRNAVRADNPFPWFRIPLGVFTLPTSTTPPVDCGSTTVGHYLTNLRVVHHAFVPAIADAFGARWPLLVTVAALGVILSVRGNALERVLGAVTLLSAIAYIWTPATAGGQQAHSTSCFFYNTRFATPALTLGLLLVALASGKWRRPAPMGITVALVLLLATNVPFTPERLAAALATGFLVIAIMHFRLHMSRLMLAGAATAVTAAALAIGWRVQTHFLEHRYPAGRWLPDPIGASYERLRTVSHARIAIAGFLAHYPLYGADLSNWIDFPAQRGPHGIFRRITNCQEWHDALAQGHYAFVVTENHFGNTPPPEAAWTRSYPAATLIVRVGTNELFRIGGEDVDPAAGCPTS